MDPRTYPISFKRIAQKLLENIDFKDDFQGIATKVHARSMYF